jgi:hypothetical protein
VIVDASESLRALVRQHLVNGSDVEVVFDAPTREWASRRNTPTVNLFLYDIREDMRRRSVGRQDERGDDQVVVARHVPPRWFKLSYLVTAWTQRPEDEQRLLSTVLGCLIAHDRIPPDVLVGSLEGLPAKIPLTCALPPHDERALSDMWSALGGELKPSLDVVIVAPFRMPEDKDISPPVLAEPRLHVTSEATETTEPRVRYTLPSAEAAPRETRTRQRRTRT